MKKILLLSLILSYSCASFSQIVDPFSIRFQTNQKGGLVALANTSVGCNCTANNEMPPGGTSDNNNFSMSFVDVDSDATTFMSSGDQLDLANCSEITWAGLYWLGHLDNTPANTPNYNIRNQVKLNPNGTGYVNLTADEILDNSTGKSSYFCFKDITSIVQANPINATYDVANVVTDVGTNTFGGWTIMVVYKNIYESMKNLTVFDGLANVSPGFSGTVDISLSGFLTPPTGAVNFELGVVAHDGDRGQAGDQLSFNGAGTFVNISDGIHPVNNVFNSTISNGGVVTPLRNPSYNNNLGHDANIYAPDNSGFNYIGNSATNASIRVSTQNETILTSVITSAIDIYEPDLRASVSYTDLNAGTVEPGDILEYSIVAKNIGSDVSLNTILTDTLDNRLAYIPGTISITYGPNTGVKTDALDTDQAEFILADNVVSARIGTGADGINGGQVVNSPNGADSTVITFQVQLTNDCAIWQCGNVLENKAYISGTGQISGITNGNDGASDLLDQNGCPSLQSGIVAVDVSNCLDTVILFTDSLCVGETISLSFPNSTFLTYDWSGPNGFSSTISNPTVPNAQLIDAGDYILHVYYEGVECITDTTAPVFVTDNPTIQLNQLQSDTCFNLGEGFINISGVGNAPFSYAWSNNDTDSVANDLNAGTYNVTVTDQYGCSVVDTFTVTEPPLLEVTASITSDYNGQDISCFDASDGSATASGTGGVLPYSLLWTPSLSTNDTITGLDIGVHLVTLTDDNGCIAEDSVTLSQPDTLSLSAIATDVLCFSDTTGAIDLTVSGGTQPYAHNWSNFATTEDLINLDAGFYTDTVTDTNGCFNVITLEITEPTDSMSFTNVNAEIFCFGDSTGAIDLTVTGGTTPYTYNWSNNEITEDITGIPSGVYTVTVTDSNNCSQNTSIDVIEPTEMIINSSFLDPVCQLGTQGSIDLDVVGGTPGYTYSWNNAETIDSIINLNAGTYTCVVIDSNQCVDTVAITLTDPDAVVVSHTQVDVLCYGDSTGSIDITPAGGTPGYTYVWSNLEITQDITNIPAGLYYVDVYDTFNCGGFLSMNIFEPDTAVYISSNSFTDVLCFGDSTGTLSIDAAGGVGPYTYLWNNLETTQNIQNIPAGIYEVVVTDSNLCTAIFIDTILEPTDIELTETHVDVLCFGDATGSINLTPSGGVSPYSFVWSNGQFTEDLSQILAGNYTVIVTDDNNCLDTLTTTITEPAAPVNLSSIAYPVLCHEGSDGSIDLTVTGGTAGYSYLWDTNEISEDIDGLETGTYFVTVTDTNGCSDTLSTFVSEPAAPISLSISATPVCFGDSTGIAIVVPVGGTPGYSYLWDTSDEDTLSQLEGLSQGLYSVLVTDTNGCENTISVYVEEPIGLAGCVNLDMPNVFTPNGDFTNDLYLPTKITNIKYYNLVILNRWGNVVFMTDDINEGWDGTYKDSECSEGVYFWKVDYIDNYDLSNSKHGHLNLIRY